MYAELLGGGSDSRRTGDFGSDTRGLSKGIIFQIPAIGGLDSYVLVMF
jgi:hypothetical protein